MPTFETEIMREARTLARLQRAAASQRAALRRTEKAIRAAKKTLRALVNAGTKPAAWEESGAKSKIHGTGAGQ